MTTAVKPMPDHGERACYLRGCRCTDCSAANYRYMSRYRLEREHGHKRRVPSGQARATIARWLNAGWSYTPLAALIGCSDTVIVDLVAGTPRLNAATAELIRRLPAQPGQPVGRAHTDGTGTIRRGRAMVRIGYQVNAIAKEIGMHPDALGRLINRDDSLVLVSTALAMTALYRRWAWRPGPCQQSRSRAQRLGWHGPMAWDTDTIDDPNAQPEVDDLDDIEAPSASRLGRHELAAERRELVQKFMNSGYLPSEIATRLGMNANSVRAICAELRTGQRRDRTKKQVAA
jgi:plasmid maintenance system antidote protein VapI